MNAFVQLCRHRASLRLKLPAAMLLFLLQRTPAVRFVAAAEEIITASPLGAVLRSVIATAASLGALHSLAGATVLVASLPGPASASVGTPINPIGFTVTDTINIGSWMITGSLPPGLVIEATQGGAMLTGPGVLDATTPGVDDGYGGSTGNQTTTPILRGVPTQPGDYTIKLQAFEFGGTSGLASKTFDYVIKVAGSAAPNTPPTFTTQPAPQSVVVGSNVTLSAAASGTPVPTYQWQRNGSPLIGATNATLALTNVQLTDAGTYMVIATNSAGNVTSTPVTLAVTAPPTTNVAPSIARHPVTQTIANGSTVVFNVDAAGSPAPTYQWRKDGAPISGATRAALVLTAAKPADTGSYSVVITNASGTATSNAATLALSDEPNFGHLLNLSVLTSVTATVADFSVGTVIGGGGTTGIKPILVRAMGPSLVAFGLGGVIADPKIDLVSNNTTIGTNDNWSGDAQITSVGSQVGAFPFVATTSKDAAILNSTATAGSYAIKVNGVGGATGAVLAELYDAGGSSITATTPRLINLSVIKQMDPNENLSAGFVLGGSTSRTVLIRAVGPTLGTLFGMPGAMPDPKLVLFADSTPLASNDNWGGDAQLNAVGSAVGAFPFADPASKDAMLLITLPPGNYAAQVSGASGSTGSALVEVYEVP